MKTILTLLLLLASSALCPADQPPSREWDGLPEYLGRNFDAKTAADFKARFGASTESKSKSDVILDFEDAGVSLTLREGSIEEVTFQLAPGKRIADYGYTGPMPDSIHKSRRSPQAALAIFGSPIEDTTKGYQQLTYLQNGILMTLHYGPGLDYVSFRRKPAEQDATSNP